jgi:hypothetical protein
MNIIMAPGEERDFGQPSNLFSTRDQKKHSNEHGDRKNPSAHSRQGDHRTTAMAEGHLRLSCCFAWLPDLHSLFHNHAADQDIMERV